MPYKGPRSKGYPNYSDRPRFIDQLAVDVVVSERRYMKLTSAEKQHAAHRLHRMGLTPKQIGEILHVTSRTADRLLRLPPPPILDVDEHGNFVNCDKDGTILVSAGG